MLGSPMKRSRTGASVTGVRRFARQVRWRKRDISWLSALLAGGGGRSKVNHYQLPLPALRDAAPRSSTASRLRSDGRGATHRPPGYRDPSPGGVSETGNPDFNRALSLIRWVAEASGYRLKLDDNAPKLAATWLKGGASEEQVKRAVQKVMARRNPPAIRSLEYFTGRIQETVALDRENLALANAAAPVPVAPAPGAAVAPSTTNPEPTEPASDEAWRGRLKTDERNTVNRLTFDAMDWAKTNRVPNASDDDCCRRWVNDGATPDLIRAAIKDALACGIKPTSLDSFDDQVWVRRPIHVKAHANELPLDIF